MAELAARDDRLRRREAEIRRLRLERSEERASTQRHRADRMQVLAENSGALSSELDRDRLVTRIVEAARELTGAAYAALFLRPDLGAPEAADPPIFIPVALAGAPREAFPDISRVDPERLRFEGVFRPLFMQGRRQLVPDVAAEAERHGFPPDHPPIGSYAAEPLRDRAGRVIGALLIGDARPFRFVESDAELVCLLAGQAAVALENAALYEGQLRTQRAMEAERELLAEVTARLHSVMHSMRDGLIVFDRAHRAVIVNPVARAWLGIEDDPLGWTPADFGREVGRCFADPAVAAEIARRTSSETAESRMEFELIWPQRRWVERLTAPIHGPGGEPLGVVVVYHDVTERREAERLKDEFISIAAHELRTPLTTIKAHVQMLHRRVEAAESPNEIDLPRAARQLASVDEQTARLARLIDELLDVSRIQTGRLDLDRRPLDLGQLAAMVVENMRLAVDTHPLALERGPGPWPVLGDGARLEQVLANLIANAVKYSDPGRPIEVALSPAAGPDGERLVRLAVRDRGVGIAPEELPRVFDRFYRAVDRHRRPHSGLGLGLYIASEIVARHGGRLSAESTLGEGSTFVVELPLA